MAKKTFIPFEKLSKKEQKKINSRRRSDSFGVKMISKVEPDKKKFKRHPKHKERYF